jgi:3-deoxy-manno-octulosonate cytidylyltransferase (CMP-KDO synthetase)
VSFHVIIPVRYGATRLPGKPLLDVAGKPLVQHVYERAVESCAESVVIATDSEEIRAVAEGFGARTCLTSKDHPSGTDRLAEAVVALGFEPEDVVVNLQGDEPLMPPSVIQAVAQDLTSHDNIGLTTVCQRITKIEDLFNPNIVKVVLSKRGFALYFSRAPIPWEQAHFSETPPRMMTGLHYRHFGIYAYRVGFLQQYLSWEPSPLGQMESLEQLRVLWNGQRIHAVVTDEVIEAGVDTPDDLARVRNIFAKRQQKEG